MPGKVKVKIISGRNLPVMDRSSDTTDAYVEIKLGSTTYKTDVCRKSLHPQWNSDWYRFEVDDSELQDEPLQIRLMDHDTYSANDAIGKVYLDLNPLLLPAATLFLKYKEGNSHDSTTSPNSVMSGWIPVYDTMHGIRGEVNIVVKVELFSDFNKFRQSSCGVQFFCSPVIPHGYFAQVINGFVEELVVNDDPEYQWIDKIRTPRASNEARQTLFFKLSGELQRKIGVKALDLGGNAVIGYSQSFDLEGESGIVARGIGTAVMLIKMIDLPAQTITENNIIEERAQSYLKFLGSAKSFFLNSDSDLLIKKSLPRPWPSPSTSMKSLKLLEDIARPEERLMTRHLSDKEFNTILRPLPTVLHHSKSLQTLLKQEDMRGRGYGISHRFRKFRNTSHNMLSKKMTALKAKLGDSTADIESDTTDAKKRHAYKYRRTQSDSTGMAEILVRSVFNATSSLDDIAESPQSAHHEFTTIEDENENETLDDSTVSLPDTSTGTHSSNASITSSDTSSLDDENGIELETVSHIVETVRKLSMIQHPLHDQILLTDPGFEDKLYLLATEDMCSRSDDGFNTSETLEPDTISNVDTLSLDKDSIIESHSLPKMLLPTHTIPAVLEEANLIGSFTAPTTPEDFSEKPFFLQSLENIKIDEAKTKLGCKFTSLHNIHDAFSSYNDYSAHKGKETVLGELFHRVASKPIEETVLSRTKFTSLHNIHDAASQMNKHSAHKGKETVLGHIFKRVETKPVILRNQSYFTKTFKKSPTVHSLAEMDKSDNTIRTKFTSLHNIHDACSKINEYSAHKGKETVLGELFHKIANNSEVTIKEKHGFLDLIKDGKDKILHAPMELFHRLDSKLHENKPPKNDSLLTAALSNVVMGTVNEILATSDSKDDKTNFFIGEKEQENPFDFNLAAEKNSPPESIKSDDGPKEKSLMGKILGSPKTLFHSKPQQLKNDKGLLGTALGNVLMESANEIMATSKLEEKASVSEPCSPQLIENENNFESQSEPTTPAIKPKASLKSRFLKGPKMLFQRLDSKRKEDDCIKHPHGLLGTALENVLRDSVNEVMATSGRHYRPVESNLPPSGETNLPSPSVETNLPSPPIGFKDDKKLDEGFIKSGTKKLVQGPKNLFHRLDSKLHKKHDEGLLRCALDNVLMDTVNDILVTSNPNTPTSPPVNVNNFANLPIVTNKPINTEIDRGTCSGLKSMHACLTPHRNVETPAPPKEIQRPDIGHHRTESIGTRISHSPAKLNSIPAIHRRSSDSDLSITPKGNSLTGSDRSGGYSSGQFMRNAVIQTTVPQENFDLMEYPFLTLSKYPTGFISFIGGAVSVRSVKLLERITNIEEPESRDIWWSEIRMEIRSHARSLNCNSVLGYTETTSICDDVCVLSATGTAAIIGYQYTSEANDNVGGLPIIPKMNNKDMMTTSLDRTEFEKDKVIKPEPTPTTNIDSPEKESSLKACNICHLPYSGNAVPIRSTTSKCSICRSGKVPDVLIATIEIPDGIPSIGRGCFVQSYVCRPLRDLRGESNAKEISDGLPFLEYELHRLLINKLQVKGMNAVFGLKVRISIGERMMIGIATGTAVYLSPLPTPPLPKLVSDRSTDEKKLTQLQKSLHDTVKKNKEIYQLKLPDETNGKIQSDTDDSEDEQRSLDLSIGNKDCCILEVDDPEDVDVLNALLEPRPPDGFHVVNTEIVPGLEDLEIVKNLQMFTQIWRAKMQAPYSLDKHFHRLLQSVYFKLRRMIPCALCDLQFRVDSPEPDEIQLCVLGMALGLGDPQKTKSKRKNILTKRNDDELIFNLEEDNIPEHSVVENPPSNYLHTQTLKHRQKSPIRNRSMARQRHVPYRERHGVDITPLSYVPGGKIEKYLGNLNFFFIRETTSIREEGGLSGFIHSFVTEILAIVRAHVTALGGNAMVAYFVTECVLNHNLHKNQGQCLINVGGDVVHVTYYSEEH